MTDGMFRRAPRVPLRILRAMVRGEGRLASTPEPVALARVLGVLGLPGAAFALAMTSVVKTGVAGVDGPTYAAVVLLGGTLAGIALVAPKRILLSIGAPPIAVTWVLYAAAFVMASGGEQSPFLTTFVGSVVIAAVVTRPATTVMMALIWMAALAVIYAADHELSGREILELAVNSSILGVLSVAVSELGTRRRIETRRFARRLQRIGDRAAQARATSLTDSLTGLGNRRRFDQDLARLLARQAEAVGSANLVLVLADADHLKSVNDAYGHPMGDTMLQTIGKGIASTVRAGDHVYRIGGDEFAAIVAGSTIRALDDRIQGRITIHLGEVGTATAAVGLAAARPDDTPEALYHRADRALLRMKQRTFGQRGGPLRSRQTGLRAS